MRCTGPLALLGAYLLLLALACRLAELVARLRRGDAGKRVDPARLDVATLRRILRTRGLQCRGCIERRDLTALVNTSGWATVGELDALTGIGRAPTPVQLAHAHALAEIEEDRDDVWLMRVLPATKHHGDKEWAAGEWQELQLRVSPLLVRVCELDCSRLPAECARRGWTKPALLLRLPTAVARGWRAKVPAAADRLLAWIGRELAAAVTVVKDVEEVERDWLERSVTVPPGGVAPLRVLLLTRLLTPPLFIAALAARLKGRVTFATFTVRDSVCRRRLHSRGLDVRLGDVTLVATPEGTAKYGARRGEFPAAAPLARVLRATLPQPSDLMVVSLALVNMLAALQASQICERRWWRLVARCVWTAVRCNLCLLAAWLAVLASCRFSLANRLADGCMSLGRRLALSQVGAELRADWQWLDVWTILGTLAVFAWLTRMRCRPLEPLGESQRLWWEVLPDGTWADCFFRARRPPPSEGVEGEEEEEPEPELEEGVEQLIERLAVPSLWLRPGPTHDYVRHLPVWRHRGWRHSGRKAGAEGRLIESLMDGNKTPQPSPKSPPSPCSTPTPSLGSALDDVDSTTDTMDSESDDGVALTPPEHARHTSECAVCLETFVWRAALCGLPCGHSFHRRCIGAWLMRDHHHCPVCRWPAYKPKAVVAVGCH